MNKNHGPFGKKNIAWQRMQRLVFTRIARQESAQSIIAKLNASELPERLRADQIDLVTDSISLLLDERQSVP